MTALYPEDSVNETEILFTALPTLDDEVMASESVPQELPQHVEFLKNKLAQQQRRKQLLSQQEQKLGQMKRLIEQSQHLNTDSEKFNTQAAVLLTALQKLQGELEKSEAEKSSLVNEIRGLKQESQNISSSLSKTRAASKELNNESKANNELARSLINQLQELLSRGKSQLRTSTESAQRVQSVLKTAEAHEHGLSDSVSAFEKLQQQASAFIERAELSKTEAEQSSHKLGKLVSKNQNYVSQLDQLTTDMAELKQELVAEREEQQRLNEQTRNRNAETEKLNQQQSTLIELGQSRAEELEQELASSVRLNKKFQARLVQTEEKLKEATQHQEKYSNQYEHALKTLRANEELLTKASASLKSASSHNERFNDSLSKFQQTNEQSQHLVLRSQTSLDKLLSRNELLERENTLLSERIGTLVATANGNAHGHGNGNANPGKTPNKNISFQNFDDMQLNEGFGAEPSMDNRNGFYRLMMMLAIILPLSFIAHSVISTVGELQAEGAQSRSVGALQVGTAESVMENQGWIPAKPLLTDELLISDQSSLA